MHVRGRVVMPTGPIFKGTREDGSEVRVGVGKRVMVVVRLKPVRVGKRKNVDEFTRFCEAVGIHPEPVRTRNADRLGGDTETPSMVPDLDEKGEPVAWECSLPSMDAYHRLKAHPVVLEWWLPVAVSAPRGGGEPSIHAPIPKDISATAAKRIREMKRSLTGEGTDMVGRKDDGTMSGRKVDLEPLWAAQKADAKAFEKTAKRVAAFQSAERQVFQTVGVSEANRADALYLLECEFKSEDGKVPKEKLAQLGFEID